MRRRLGEEEQAAMISKTALFLLIFNNTCIHIQSTLYIKLACMIRMITLILPLCCLFNQNVMSLLEVYIL